MMHLPLRWRVALWSALATGFALLAFAAGTLINLYGEQIEEVDLKLASEARRISAAVAEPDHEGIAHEASEVEQQPWLAAAVFSSDGRLIHDSERVPESVARAALRLHTPTTVKTAAGEWRVLTLRDAESTVILAYNLKEVGEIVGDLLTGYMIALPLAAGIAALGGWMVAGRAMRPVREATAAAACITPERLDQRLPVAPVSDEISNLTRVINAMLDRMEASFRQADRFAADASHEIRTPLTIMKGEVEAALREPGTSARMQTLLVSVQEEIMRLQRVTEQLLLLARLDSGVAQLRHEEVDLTGLVRVACDDLELITSEHELRLGVSVDDGVRVAGDAEQLRRVVLNLLDNACKFNERGGRIECALRGERGRVVLRVTNTGGGIPADMQSRLFQRFFRADVARTGTGHGLGLSLSREIVQAHGGTLELVRSEPGTTEFCVTLPALVG